MAGGKLEMDRDPVRWDPMAVPKSHGLPQGSKDRRRDLSGYDATGKFLKPFCQRCGEWTGGGAGREKNVLEGGAAQRWIRPEEANMFSELQEIGGRQHGGRERCLR